MIRTGLVSVTFRELSPVEIIGLVKQAGLQGIEWGGDIHVPHGDLERAREVAALTVEAELTVAAYGSYYVVGTQTAKDPAFESVVATAQALGAPVIRVWAGDKGSSDADAEYWSRVVADGKRIAALAAQAGLQVAFEFHNDSLTDTPESALRLFKEIGQANVRSYWQISTQLDAEARLQSLWAMAPYLSHVHVFNFITYTNRKSLAEGLEEWSRYLRVIKNLPGDRFCMLEFVKDDSPDQFLADADALKQLSS